MKTHKFYHSIYLVVIMLFLIISARAQTNNPFIGNWEGMFMGDFKVLIRINQDDRYINSGRILMYAGDNQIQDDDLASIIINEDRIYFTIPAKETKFEGVLEKDKLAFSGGFIFPDGSIHPLSVNKSSMEVVPAATKSYMEIKNKEYSAEELQADLQFLIEKLKENHPQLYFYTSESEFETIVNSTMNNIIEPMTLEEYYLMIAPVVDAVKCSHLGIRLSSDYQEIRQQNIQSFPLGIVFVGEKAFYVTNPGGDMLDISPGAEIISINGLTVKQIIRKLLPLFPAEGNNTSTKYNQLNLYFNLYCGLLDISSPYKIEFKDKEKNRVVIIDGLSTDESFLTQVSKPSINFSQLSGNTALLEISEFTYYDLNAYIDFTDSIFQTMKEKHIHNLVLDLRDNLGGHPIFAAQLLSFLVDHEFTYFKKNLAAPEFEPLYHSMQPNKPGFNGTLYVLINGGCLSTTGHFISLLKYHTQAIFIGEEPGSTYYCNDQSQHFELPNTGIEVNIPRTTFETAVSGFEKNQPFRPNYAINPSIEDLVVGRDTYLDFVLNLISQNQ